jgi:hypothetical protein
MSCNNTTADFRPAQYNIQIWRNDTWSQILLLTANSVGSQCEIQVRKYANSTDAALTLTVGSGITLGGVNNNMITINQAVDIDAGNYVYDMTIVFPNGNEKTYIWGTFIVYDDITKI